MKTTCLAILLHALVLLSPVGINEAEGQSTWNRGGARSETIADVADEILTLQGLPYKEWHTEADIYIMYSKGDSSSKIRKPLLLIEGFFPNSLIKMGMANPLQEETILNIRPAFPEFDLIYVAWRDSEVPIEANSETLKVILLWLNEELDRNGSDERITIIGHSMGGLVARWALTQMEAKRIAHGVERYISYDTPHLGANFPLGLAYGIQGAAELAMRKKYFVKYLPSAELLILNQMEETLRSPAVREMIIHSIQESGAVDDSTNEEWQEALARAGLPKGDEGHSMTCLAISNASYQVHPEQMAPYIDVTMDARTDITGLFGGIWDFNTAIFTGILLSDAKAALLSILPGRMKLHSKIFCGSGDRAGKEITKLEVVMEKKLFFFIPIKYVVYNYLRYLPEGIDSTDLYPASFWPMGGFKSRQIREVPIFRSFRYDISSTMAMPFIPIKSALAITDSGDGRGEISLFGENTFVTSRPINHNVFSEDAISRIRKEMGLD